MGVDNEVIDNPVMVAHMVGELPPAEKELQLDIPSRPVLRTAQNMVDPDRWSYPNLRTTVTLGKRDYVAWGWKMVPDRCWGFLVVPMRWILRRTPDVTYFVRAEPDREGQMVLTMNGDSIARMVVAGHTRQSRGEFYEALQDMIKVRAA